MVVIDLYNYVNSKIKPRDTISNLRAEDGSLTTNDKEKSEVLNKFFSSVFVNEGDGPVPDFKSDYENELSNIEINEDQMYNVLKKLNSTKSPGIWHNKNLELQNL